MINPLAGRTVEVTILYLKDVIKVRVFSPIEGEPIFKETNLRQKQLCDCNKRQMFRNATYTFRTV